MFFEHVCQIIQCLCKYSKGVERDRVLNKFKQKDFEKLARLVELHKEYSQLITKTETKEKGIKEYLIKLENGLNTLINIDFSLLFVITKGDKWIKQERLKLMKIEGVTFEEIKKNLLEFVTFIEERKGIKSDKEVILNLIKEYEK